jgi:hypothetical protein
LARIERGKISETRVQETGPQVAPKPAMYTQISAENHVSTGLFRGAGRAKCVTYLLQSNQQRRGWASRG